MHCLLYEMLRRELSLLICGSDLSTCLCLAHCTVYFQAGVMGAWVSAG